MISKNECMAMKVIFLKFPFRVKLGFIRKQNLAVSTPVEQLDTKCMISKNMYVATLSTVGSG